MCLSQNYYVYESKLLCVWVKIAMYVSLNYYCYFVNSSAVYMRRCSSISCKFGGGGTSGASFVFLIFQRQGFRHLYSG